MGFERIFEQDCISKRERVERALAFQPTDRAVLHEQLSYNPDVISKYTAKDVKGYCYAQKEIGIAIRKTLDIAFPLCAPLGIEKCTEEDGIVFLNDNWNRWICERPFNDEFGAKKWLERKTKIVINNMRNFDAKKERKNYHKKIMDMQALVGETVILDIVETGFCDIFNRMGLEIFTYFYYDYPKTFHDYMEASIEYVTARMRAIADNSLMPAMLIAEDFCAKNGSIFSRDFLMQEHYPFVKDLTEALKENGYFTIYHSDGNFKSEVDQLLLCGVQGFYCLERNCGMFIEELAKQYPSVLWAGGVDGVDLMENASPVEVEKEVLRLIDETKAIERGGIFIDTSSEINPTIPVENYVAMVNAVGKRFNSKDF